MSINKIKAIMSSGPKNFWRAVTQHEQDFRLELMSEDGETKATVYLGDDKPEDAWQRCLNQFKRKLAEAEEDED